MNEKVAGAVETMSLLSFVGVGFVGTVFCVPCVAVALSALVALVGVNLTAMGLDYTDSAEMARRYGGICGVGVGLVLPWVVPVFYALS